jgi:hypothetical protein
VRILDEQLISGQKKCQNSHFQQLRTTFCSLFRILESKERKEEVVSNELYCEVWISNDLRCAESNLYQFGFLKVHVRLLSIIDFYWTEHIERMSLYEKLLTGEHMDNKIH